MEEEQGNHYKKTVDKAKYNLELFHKSTRSKLLVMKQTLKLRDSNGRIAEAEEQISKELQANF